jgi:hypothetical protein
VKESARPLLGEVIRAHPLRWSRTGIAAHQLRLMRLRVNGAMPHRRGGSDLLHRVQIPHRGPGQALTKRPTRISYWVGSANISIRCPGGTRALVCRSRPERSARAFNAEVDGFATHRGLARRIRTIRRTPRCPMLGTPCAPREIWGKDHGPWAPMRSSGGARRGPDRLAHSGRKSEQRLQCVSTRCGGASPRGRRRGLGPIGRRRGGRGMSCVTMAGS